MRFLFGKNKLKMRSKEDEEGVKTFIQYYGIKQKDVLKVKVLKELIGDNFCLMVLDSRLLYFGPQEETKISFNEIIEYLDFKRIAYKKFEMRKTPEVSLFGMTIKKESKKKEKDHVIGFVANKDNFKDIEKYVNKLNMYYFIEKTGINEEVMLQKLEENYEDADEMSKDFYCRIFNNNYNDQSVILSASESASEIKEIVNKCYKEME